MAHGHHHAFSSPTQDKNGKRDNFDFLMLKLLLRILLTYSVFATGA